MTSDVEDGMVSPGTSEEPYQSAGLTTLVPTSTGSIIDIHIEDLPTPDSTVYPQEASQRTTTPNIVTSHSMEQAGGEAQPTVEKDSLVTVTVAGIIVGFLLALGFIGGIIVVQKMLEEYSP